MKITQIFINRKWIQIAVYLDIRILLNNNKEQMNDICIMGKSYRYYSEKETIYFYF